MKIDYSWVKDVSLPARIQSMDLSSRQFTTVNIGHQRSCEDCEALFKIMRADPILNLNSKEVIDETKCSTVLSELYLLVGYFSYRLT